MNNLIVSALPFRAYSLIWNEFYRDQDLQTALTISKASGPDTTTNIQLQNVAWEKDYFTTARPWTQKGPEITIPLGTTAPVQADGELRIKGSLGSPAPIIMNPVSPFDLSYGGTSQSGNASFVSGLETDLSMATAANINELRRAFALQRYEEARARFGSRYVEYLRYLGVNSSDARLQLPEYLGGGSQVLQFSEVLQTSPTTDGDDEIGVGNLKRPRYRGRQVKPISSFL